MSYVYETVIGFLKEQGYTLEKADDSGEIWKNSKFDFICDFGFNASFIDDINIHSYDFEERNYTWDCYETEEFTKALDLKLLNGDLETDGEQLDKRIQRTKDVMIESINSLYDVEFDLNYYSDYILNDDLKEANRYVLLAIDKVRKFMVVK
jgi:hypothetical protein